MSNGTNTIALIGLGTIGLSFAALHLKHTGSNVRLFDIRDDLESYVASLLPVYLDSRNFTLDYPISTGRVKICSSLEEACNGADIIQEQGPEKLEFKKSNWAHVVQCASPSARLWSSTSGIIASQQAEDLKNRDKARLLVVHPFNPPHMIPLIEIVPSIHTDLQEVEFAQEYFHKFVPAYRTIVIKKEITGFVGNRLLFALFREACHLVATDVATVKDVDTLVETCMGPRYSIAGPFKLWNFGGGEGGLGAFFRAIGGTMENCWDDAGLISLKGTPGFASSDLSETSETSEVEDWPRKIILQTNEAYGIPTAESMLQRDLDIKMVMEAQPQRRVN